jgi:hypothetical protein
LAKPTQKRAEQAIAAFQEAARIDGRPHVSFGDRVVFELEAKQARERARTLSAITSAMARGCSAATGKRVARGADRGKPQAECDAAWEEEGRQAASGIERHGEEAL